jgi:hypothetical protein
MSSSKRLVINILQLFCMLEEWESGVHAGIDFIVDNYCEMYEILTRVNIQAILDDLYYQRKLEAMWVQVFNQAG